MLIDMLPPDLAITLKDVPVNDASTADPDLTPIVKFCPLVIVDKPETGGVTVLNPTKFNMVAPVPTVAPSNFKSTPDITLDNSEPSPLNCNAVTIPV